MPHPAAPSLDAPSLAAMPAISSLFGRLSALTAARELPQMERELLATLAALLALPTCALYRFDEQHAAPRVLRLSGGSQATQLAEDDGAAEDDGVIAVLEQLRHGATPCRGAGGHGWLYGYALAGASQSLVFLVFERAAPLLREEHAMLAGLLDVYANFCQLLGTSLHDRLTGLQNRHALDLKLGRLWEDFADPVQDGGAGRRNADGLTYWLGVIDIDRFKSINDTFGHLIGDEILLLVARQLERALRRDDQLYRYGGEEFVAIIAAPDLAAATLAFERVRRQIEQYRFPQVGRVTISGGFCVATPAVLPQIVISQADRALYEAKSGGRNRICQYGALVDQGILSDVSTGSIDLF